MDRALGDSSVDLAVSGVPAAGKIESKGRKRRAIPDTAWRNVLLENIERAGVNPTGAVKNAAEPLGSSQDPEAHDAWPHDAELELDSEMEFDDLIKEIKKMAEDPEKLVESHLGVFTDPAPPGKLLNSQG